MTRGALILVTLLLVAGTACAASPQQTYTTQCGACHMAYPPTLLPARSWKAIVAGLSHHFGEDATMGKKDTATIATFLAANAADGPLGDSRFLEGVSASMTPARITDMPFWRLIHPDLLQPGVGTGPGIRKAAACDRCHNVNGGGDD